MRTKFCLLLVSLLLSVSVPAGAVQYYVTTTVTSGGTVSPLKGKIPVTATDPTVEFQALPGYYLAEVKVNGVAVPLTDREAFSRSFAGLQQNVTIAGRFVKDPIVTALNTAGGLVDPRGTIFVPYSTSKTLSITPTTGFHIKDVTVDGVSQGPITSYTFDNVRAKHALKASFLINSYEVSTVPSDGGRILPAGQMSVKHGQKKTFTVKPNATMRIESLTVNGEPVAGLSASGANQLPLFITGNTIIAATFAEIHPAGLQRLNGTYHITSREFFFSQNAEGSIEGFSGGRIIGTFDGNGGCSMKYSGVKYREGYDSSDPPKPTVFVTPESDSSTCSYTINDAGVFTLNFGNETISGAVSVDGNLIVSGRQTNQGGTGYRVETLAGVKAGAGMTKGALAGTYHLVSQEGILGKTTNVGVSKSNYGNRVSATFDGVGGCSISLNGAEYRMTGFDGEEIVTMDVSTESGTTSSCAYTVSPDGMFTITMTMNGQSDKFSGRVSADGNAVVIGGPHQRSETGRIFYGADLAFGVKGGTAMETSSLAGSYRLYGGDISFFLTNPPQVWPDGGSESMFGNTVDVAFDGVGGCSVSYNGTGYAKGGSASPESGESSACSYSVAADGSFTLSITFPDGSDYVTGWASADGNAIVIGGPKSQPATGGTSYKAELMVGARIQ